MYRCVSMTVDDDQSTNQSEEESAKSLTRACKRPERNGRVSLGSFALGERLDLTQLQLH